MTPTQLKSQSKKPLDAAKIDLLIGAITEFYARIHPEIVVEGVIELPKPPKFFQFTKWAAFIAKWQRIGSAVVHLIEVIVKIFK